MLGNEPLPFSSTLRMRVKLTHHTAIRDHPDHKSAPVSFFRFVPQLKDMCGVRPELDDR